MSGVNQLFNDFEIQSAQRRESEARNRAAELEARVQKLELSLAGHLALQTAALESLRTYVPDHALLTSVEYQQSLIKFGQKTFARSRNWDEIRDDVRTLIHI